MSTGLSAHITEETPAMKTKPEITSLLQASPEAIHEVVGLFKLLADDTRVRILYFLHQTTELNVREMCRLLRQRQPSVSHHLAMLREAGLIEMRREGKHNFYHLVPTRLEKFLTAFSGSLPGQPARIVFDAFELRYTPQVDS